MAQTSEQQPAEIAAYPGLRPGGSTPLSRDQVRTVFGQIMGLVALMLGCLALGAYIGRDLSGGIGILFFVAGFACIFALSLEPPRNGGLPGFWELIGVLGGLEAAGDGLGCRFVSRSVVWRCRGVLCGRIRTAVIGGGRRGGVGRRGWCPGSGAPAGQLSTGSARIRVSAACQSVCQGQRAGRCSVQRRLW